MARQNVFSEEPANSAGKSAHPAEKSAHSAPYNNRIIKKDNNNNNVVVDVDDNCEVDLVLAFAVRATGAVLKSPSFSCHFTSRQ